MGFVEDGLDGLVGRSVHGDGGGSVWDELWVAFSRDK